MFGLFLIAKENDTAVHGIIVNVVWISISISFIIMSLKIIDQYIL